MPRKPKSAPATLGRQRTQSPTLQNKVRKIETKGQKYVLDLLAQYPKSKFNKLPTEVRQIILLYSHPQNISSYSRASKSSRRNVSQFNVMGLSNLAGI